MIVEQKVLGSIPGTSTQISTLLLIYFIYYSFFRSTIDGVDHEQVRPGIASRRGGSGEKARDATQARDRYDPGADEL